MNTFDYLHGIGAYLLIFSPYILPKYYFKKFGYYISLYMIFVFLGWVFNNGQCALNHKTNDSNIDKYGVGIAVINDFCKDKICKFNIDKNKTGHIFNCFYDFFWLLSAYILAQHKPSQNFIIIMGIIHSFQLYKISFS